MPKRQRSPEVGGAALDNDNQSKSRSPSPVLSPIPTPIPTPSPVLDPSPGPGPSHSNESATTKVQQTNAPESEANTSVDYPALENLQATIQALFETREYNRQATAKIAELNRRLKEERDTVRMLLEKAPELEELVSGKTSEIHPPRTDLSETSWEMNFPSWEDEFPLPKRGDLEAIGNRITESTRHLKYLESVATLEKEEEVRAQRWAAAEKVAKQHRAFESAQGEMAVAEESLLLIDKSYVLITRHNEYIESLVNLTH